MIIRGKAITAIKKEQRRKKLKHHAVLTVLILLTFLIYIGVTALALHLPALRIKNVIVRGVAGERLAEVNSRASSLLKEKKWLIFPRYTTISSAHKLAANVAESIPWVEEVTATIESNTARFGVTERKPAYLVCREKEKRECYYADINTLIFAPAPDFSAPVYPELTRPGLASTTLIIKNLFESNTSQKIQDLERALSAQEIDLIKFQETDEGSFKAYVKGGWYIYFTREEPVPTVIGSLKAVMNSENFSSSYKKNPQSLEYVDVRLADKVFYKFNKGDFNAPTAPAQ